MNGRVSLDTRRRLMLAIGRYEWKERRSVSSGRARKGIDTPRIANVSFGSSSTFRSSCYGLSNPTVNVSRRGANNPLGVDDRATAVID